MIRQQIDEWVSNFLLFFKKRFTSLIHLNAATDWIARIIRTNGSCLRPPSVAPNPEAGPPPSSSAGTSESLEGSGLHMGRRVGGLWNVFLSVEKQKIYLLKPKLGGFF